MTKLKKFATWPVRGLEFVADFDYVDKGAVPCGLMDWFDRWV